MSTSPDAIRADIEQTRRELGGDVDALADKVSPHKIMERQTDKIRGAVGSVRDRIMGVADDAGSAISDAGSSVASGVEGAKDKVVSKTEGHPIGVGLIAFGVGLVIASLIPASAKERRMAEDVKEQAQPLVDELTDAAKEAGSHLKAPAEEAAMAVKDAATDAVDSVKAEATDATHEVKDRAAEARQNVAEH